MSRLLVSLLFLSFASAQIIPNRYIVELEGEPAVTLAAKDKSLAAHRTAVRDAQSHIRQAVESLEGRVFDSVDTVANALIVRIAGDKVHVLESIPGVRRVTPVYLSLIHI